MGKPIDSGNWQREARQLRAQGKAAHEIAALLGQAASAVREVLRGTPRPPPAVLGAGAKLIEPHAPRVPRVILDQAALHAAAVAFAAGEIDRAAMKLAAAGVEGVTAEAAKPAVPPKKSITSDYIICLEDGRKFKSLKRHLRTQYNLSPEEYREKWGLPSDYPMVAPAYAKARSALAKQMGHPVSKRRA
jgi:predicted transcriptional regulator